MIHPNLKFVLLVQSFAIGCYSSVDLIAVVGQFALRDLNYLGLGVLHGVVIIFFAQYVAAIGHVLMLERILATVLVSRYEWDRTSWIFSLVWFLALVNLIERIFKIIDIFNRLRPRSAPTTVWRCTLD